MDDKNLTPSLTLEDTPAAPSLTLDPFAGGAEDGGRLR